METFYNEVLSFSAIIIVVIMLAYFTKRKEDLYKKQKDKK